MAKVKFLGIEGEQDVHEITMFGYTFTVGKAVKVPAEEQPGLVKMLKGHPQFDVKDEANEDVTDVEPKKQTDPEQEKAADVAEEAPYTPAEPPSQDDAFVAVGANRFSDGQVQTEESLEAAQSAYATKQAGAGKEPTKDELIQMANALGLSVDNRWSKETLRQKIQDKVDADKQ